MKKRILALMMALVMVFGLNTTFLAAPSGTVDNTEMVPAPENVHWVYENGKNTWKVSWDAVEGVNDFYGAFIYKDGVSTWVFVGPNMISTGNGVCTADFSKYIDGAGKYKIGISGRIFGNTGLKDAGIGYTEEVTYAPEKTLAAPQNVAISDAGQITFDVVEGAAYYVVELTYYDINNPENHWVWTDFNVTPEAGAAQGTVDLLTWLKDVDQDYDEDYTVRVRAMSADINAAANSTWSEKSNVYKFRLSVEEAKEVLNEKLDDALNKNNPEAAKWALADTENATLVELLKDADFAAKVEAADAAYKIEMGENYKLPTSSTNLVDASKVKVVGDAFNAELNETVQLTFAAPATPVTLTGAYFNAVQLDIKLLINDESMTDLSVPVTITMPIPTGVAKENLVILHYHEEGKDPQIITPVVNADGTMTFTVTGFSTFVVANTEADGTGDTDPVGALVAIMALSAVVAVVAMKKKSVVK